MQHFGIGIDTARYGHQVFGIWTTGADFDPHYETQSGEPTEQKTEASGPMDESETPQEPKSKEVTAAPASLEPVTERVAEAKGTALNSVILPDKKQANRPAIDYAALREQVSLQQVLERTSRIPLRGVQHRGPCPLHEPSSTTGRLVPRQYQSGETDRNGRITKRGNPLARTILVECAWASLRYNPWASAVYERISGKQKTRKKKAAVALARKISVIAWALLRDDKDWEPKRMIEVTESFGKMPEGLKVTLQSMKPKENSDQRKSRLRKEARQAKETAADATSKKTTKTDSRAKPKPKADQTATLTTPKPRRARKPVSRSVARA